MPIDHHLVLRDATECRVIRQDVLQSRAIGSPACSEARRDKPERESEGPETMTQLRHGHHLRTWPDQREVIETEPSSTPTAVAPRPGLRPGCCAVLDGQGRRPGGSAHVEPHRRHIPDVGSSRLPGPPLGGDSGRFLANTWGALPHAPPDPERQIPKTHLSLTHPCTPGRAQCAQSMALCRRGLNRPASGSSAWPSPHGMPSPRSSAHIRFPPRTSVLPQSWASASTRRRPRPFSSSWDGSAGAGLMRVVSVTTIRTASSPVRVGETPEIGKHSVRDPPRRGVKGVRRWLKTCPLWRASCTRREH